MIKPDDTVVVRIVRSEMGQGTITGLAQLVAEELECRLVEGDHRISDAGRERQAQARRGAHISTGGSRGIRKSHEYVRKGGAAARMMLIQAAANEWKVPAGEVHGGQGRDHAQGVEPHDDLRQGGGSRRQAAGRRRSRR